MIVYQADKKDFLLDYNDRDIEDVIHAQYQATTNRKVAQAEVRSWKESLGYVARVLTDSDIADDVGVAIEFILDADDATMAAIRAANTRPSAPGGSNFIIDGYARSPRARFGARISAHMPGRTTISGISSLR